MGPPAVLFDIDGTLVDSNYVHVHAWLRAFESEKVPVEAWRIHRSIGMDGDTLLQTLAGDASESVRSRLKEHHSLFHRESSSLLRPLPGARELLHHIAHDGIQVVLATSAPDDELAILRDVLDCDDVVAAMTSSADVDTAKPEPDLIAVALERAGTTADRAVFIGDAVWDMQACVRAGVRCIGVRSGGVGRDELLEAGAESVFDNAQDLLDHLDTTPIPDLTDSAQRV
ncbi:HAD family hydrolase [Mycolicibacterium confluentis]|uniref:Haloacid dehalogenase n=1 Tax=Mycolicibacterium confluentis TaxID=28047 RepID=A0A7I7Y383_9MYCO|nr:HAD family hydrolase [Mycolicibacterium confluentis]MCV7318140.1 HAD family hydrolase [Mycolicibacterium confluentis]ORV31265.1 HAD family hydrolase [Mycolicibacterium confluentis]BBZ36049.1 haloacid dehalogenase [Mycolicibacterium confluentis]